MVFKYDYLTIVKKISRVSDVAQEAISGMSFDDLFKTQSECLSTVAGAVVLLYKVGGLFRRPQPNEIRIALSKQAISGIEKFVMPFTIHCKPLLSSLYTHGRDDVLDS